MGGEDFGAGPGEGGATQVGAVGRHQLTWAILLKGHPTGDACLLHQGP